MCIRDSTIAVEEGSIATEILLFDAMGRDIVRYDVNGTLTSVSYTHLRAHETVLDLVCRLLLEQKKREESHACE